MSYDEYESRRTISLPIVVAGLAVVAAIGISLFAVASVREQSMQVDLLETDVRELEGRLEEFRLSDEALAGRLKSSETKLREKDQGIAPLAARVLKSVFTVKTDEGLGVRLRRLDTGRPALRRHRRSRRLRGRPAGAARAQQRLLAGRGRQT